MAMVSGEYSISGLATELGRDRRTIAKLVEGIEPVRRRGNANLYRLTDVIAAMRGSTGGKLDANDELARLRKAQADKTELEVALLEARLIPAEDVERAQAEMIVAARAKLLALPSKMARRVVAEIGGGSISDIQALLEGAVHEALGELAEMRAGDLRAEAGD